MREVSLQTYVSRLLLVFGVLVTLLVALVSVYVNERLERSVWHALLSAQAKPVETSPTISNAVESHGELRVYEQVGATADQTSVPAQLRNLPAGFHDEIAFDDREHSVLVTDVDGRRRFLTYDTSINEGLEQSTWNLVLLFGAALAIGIWVMARLTAARAARSVLDLAAAVRGLTAQDQIPTLGHRYAVKEVSEIATSIDGLLDRIQGFVEREREFINAVSHELTTPIAVIAGAADVLKSSQQVPADCLPALRRIDATAHSMNDILKALLFLAREPRRSQRDDETCRIDQLLMDLIELHVNEFPERRAALRVGLLQPVSVSVAPGPATIVFGNLIHNALQHSLADTIAIRLDSNEFVIHDNGRGMSAEAISRAYSQRARAGTGNGGGLGLSLVQRVCNYLGWRFAIAGFETGGTVITIQFGATVVNSRVDAASER